MMRIGVIGNSHLAALKLGWEAIKQDFGEVQLTFFGARGDHARKLTLVDGCLTSSDETLLRFMKELSGSISKIDPACYDKFLIHGLDFSITQVVRVASKYRAEDHAKDNRQPISDECFFLACIGCLRESILIQIVVMLRRITDKPIAVLPTPMRSEEDQRLFWRQVQQSGDDEKIAAIFAAAARHIAADLNFLLFLQPASTLSTCVKTKTMYRQGSVRLRPGLNIESAKGDYRHMNATYGELVLRDAFAELRLPSSI